MTSQSGSLVNNTGATRVGYFGDIIWESCVYPKFGNMENILMGGMVKEVVK